jgi:DNA-nicking Smr family endonuclease
MSEPKRSAGRAKLLSALDLELWSAVTADVRPFRARKLHAKPEPIAASDTRPIGAASTYREAPPPPKAVPALSEIDHRTRAKLRRGRLDVDAKLDLHGMRQAEAHHALVSFLRRSQANGAKVAIVVTGKGSGGDAGGVLRRMAPLWLQAPALRDVVVGFGEASRKHGGEGALYVRIRRSDKGRPASAKGAG